MSFSTAEAKSLILSSWDIEVCGYLAFVADCDHKISIVKIYNAPNKMPDSVLIGRLSVYGTVLSFRRDLVNDTVFNGIRTARVEIKHDIPSTVRIITSKRDRERERRFRVRSHHHRHEHYYDEDRYESRDGRHRREESSTEEEDSSSSDEEEWTTVRKKKKHRRR